ncbi:MAG: hypothetical protein ACLFVO_16960 [Chloroflexaceae bacterium]
MTQSGTYRLRVRNTSGTGNPAYTYDLRMTTVACSDGYESNDTPAQAHPFTLGDTQTHRFCTIGDEDWVTVTGTAGQTIWVETGNAPAYLRHTLTLYAQDGTTTLNTGRTLADGRQGLAYTFADSGTAYLRVRNTVDRAYPNLTYDLQITSLACSDGYETDDWRSQAQPFPIGSTQARAFCTPFDQDWVAFTARTGQTVQIRVRNPADGIEPVFALFDADGRILLPKADALVTYAYTAPTAGTYYLRFTNDTDAGDPTATYDLELTYPGNDPYEPNDTPAQALPFPVGTTQTHITYMPGGRIDPDWVTFTVTETARYRLETTNLVALLDTTLGLYYSDGTSRLALAGRGPVFGTQVLTVTLPPDTYYVQAMGTPKDNPPRTYDLTISLVAFQPDVTPTVTPSPTITPIPTATWPALRPDPRLTPTPLTTPGVPTATITPTPAPAVVATEAAIRQQINQE